MFVLLRQITIDGAFGWALVAAYSMLAVAAWARVFIDRPSRLAVFGHVCVALAWTILSGRAWHGMVTDGVALQAVVYALASIMLLALSSTAHIAHALIVNMPLQNGFRRGAHAHGR